MPRPSNRDSKGRPIRPYKEGEDRSEIAKIIDHALADPGYFCRRGGNYEQALHQWQRDAVLVALEHHGHHITENPKKGTSHDHLD